MKNKTYTVRVVVSAAEAEWLGAYAKTVDLSESELLGAWAAQGLHNRLDDEGLDDETETEDTET